MTDQEKVLLQLIVAGKTDSQIGQELHLSDRTVRRRLLDLYTRLGAKNRAEAALLPDNITWLSNHLCKIDGPPETNKL
ncbi:MAG: helix-turn-helix transcriptional regulator [Anaerolineae bacterium]|nr:helix-turn-helix transcriptional regulator [Anaerolineae bacterium]